MDNINISQCVIKTKAGSKKDFEKLYLYTYERAKIIAVAILKNQSDAEDVLQDSYIKALSSLNSLSEPEKFQSWFNRIVTNNCKNYLVKKKPELFSQYDITAAYNDFDKLLQEKEYQHFTYDVENKETYKKVRKCIDDLPDDQRICVIMHYYNEMTVDEIASTLGISRNTVLSRLSYARKKLKKSMQKDKDDKLFGFMLFPLIQTAENDTTKQIPKFNAIRSRTYKKIILSNEAKAIFKISAAKAAVLKFSLLSTVKKVVISVGAVALISATVFGVAELVQNSKEAEKSKPTTNISQVTPAEQESKIEFANGKMFIIAPNGKLLFYNNDNAIYMLNIDSGDSKVLFDGTADCFTMINERLYFVSNNKLYCFDTNEDKLLWNKESNADYIIYNECLFSLSTKTGVIEELDENGKAISTATLSGSYFTVDGNKIYYYDKSSNLVCSEFSTTAQHKVLVDGSKNEGMRFAYQINEGNCVYPSFDSDITGKLNIQSIENGLVNTETLPESFVDFCYNNNQIIYSTNKNGVFVYSNGKSTQIYDSCLYFVNAKGDYSLWYNAKDDCSLLYSYGENSFISVFDFEIDDFDCYNGYLFYENSTGKYMTTLDKED